MSEPRYVARVLALSVVLASIPMALAAQCNQALTSLSQADRDWWAVHGCQQSYFLWQWRAYNLEDDEWEGQGWNDACNSRLNYPKFWNASYLVNYGLSDDYSNTFHFSQTDYRPLAEARSSRFHDSEEYDGPDPGLSGYGQWEYDPFGANNITLGCGLFDSVLDTRANPASRAGDFMHESWHGWGDEYDYDFGPCNGHQCQTGNCTLNGCDYFYFHRIRDYVPGALYQNDGTARRFHSPNQVQVEFLCDVNQLPAPSVPMSVRLTAKSDADNRAVNRFINGPGYKCGDPRPW